MLIKANPAKDGYVNRGICCGKGKWGFDASMLEDKIVDPMVKDESGKFRLTDYHEAFVMMAKKLEAVAQRNGRQSIGIAVSDRYTNEEAYAIKKFADTIGAVTFTFNRRQSGVKEVLVFQLAAWVCRSVYIQKLYILSDILPYRTCNWQLRYSLL